MPYYSALQAAVPKEMLPMVTEGFFIKCFTILVKICQFPLPHGAQTLNSCLVTEPMERIMFCCHIDFVQAIAAVGLFTGQLHRLPENTSNAVMKISLFSFGWISSLLQSSDMSSCSFSGMSILGI